jgi:predicted nucleotidyltransferase
MRQEPAPRHGRDAVEHVHSAPSDALTLLGVASSAVRILRYFLLRPTGAVHARHLQRVLNLGAASVQRDLERLVGLGALDRSQEGRLIRYRMVAASPLWTAFRILLGTAADPTTLVQDALRDVRGVQAAFVYGSTAKQTRGKDSDVDVFVVGDANVDRRALLGQLAEAGVLLQSEINTIRYTPQSLAERLNDSTHPGAHFVREVLEGPKYWVAGDPESLRPLTTAAGVQIDERPLQKARRKR